jgi:hypothetical protein
MKQEVKIGQTDYTVLILIRDTAGAPKTGLTNASAGIDVCYTRVETDNDVVLTAGAPVALATPALTDPHLDWGFLQVDATNAPGLYRLDIADGVFATGAWSAVVSLIATGIDPCQIEFILVPDSPYTGVNVSQWNGTAVHAPALAGVPYVDIHNWLGAAAPAMTGDAYARVGAPVGASISADIAAAKADTVEILTRVPDATAGANGGLTICGSNAATTFATLSVTGQLDAGNVLVDSTAVITGASTLASLSVTGQLDAGNVLVDTTTVLTGATTLSGAVSLGSTLGVTGASTLASLSITGQLDAGNALVDTTTVLTGAITGGATTLASLTSTGALTVSNGIIVTASTANRSAIALTGNGTGNGMTIISGNGLTGSGINISANSTNGSGILITGVGSGHGLSVGGGATGHGFSASGGGTSGDGIYAAAGYSGYGIEALGFLAGAGIAATGGATGPGILTTGGGNNANADGIRAVAGGALAADIDADIVGNITGTIDTVTTLTNKTGFALSATGADLILKTSTFALAVADAIWDEPVDAGNHAIGDSAALYLRNLYQSIVTRIAQCGDAGGATTIDLDDAASAVNDYYKGQVIAICGGTGAGQARACTGYAGGTKIATIGPAWATNPDGDSWFAIINVGSAVVSAIDNIDLSATMKTSINAEMVDVIGTDTIAEMAQGIPPATPTLKQALMYLYMALRDETNTTATLITIKNDAGTVICKATLSDDATTFVKGELVSGP